MSDSIEDYFILDVRDEEEYENRRIDGSCNIPYRMILVVEYPGAIGHALKKIPKDKTILMFCSTGKRASLAGRRCPGWSGRRRAFLPLGF